MKLTERQKDGLRIIENYYIKNKRSISCIELGKIAGLETRVANDFGGKLRDLGVIKISYKSIGNSKYVIYTPMSVVKKLQSIINEAFKSENWSVI